MKGQKGDSMSVRYDPRRLDDANYTLGTLCCEFYERFGGDAKEIISRICYQRGVALGKRLLKKEDKSFGNAINTFVTVSEKTKTPGKLISLERDKAIIQGSGCPLGLEKKGRPLCEMMMTLDQGILEEASGKKIRFKIKKTLAAGDAFCKVIFEMEE
jgi:predicted hydrocarbon binding protein